MILLKKNSILNINNKVIKFFHLYKNNIIILIKYNIVMQKFFDLFLLLILIIKISKLYQILKKLRYF